MLSNEVDAHLNKNLKPQAQTANRSVCPVDLDQLRQQHPLLLQLSRLILFSTLSLLFLVRPPTPPFFPALQSLLLLILRLSVILLTSIVIITFTCPRLSITTITRVLTIRTS